MLISNFPELRQVYEYDCGANALQSVLVYYGFDIREGKIIKMAKSDKNGTKPENILLVFEKLGLKAKLISPMSLEDLKKYLDKHRPVILAVQAWSGKPKNYSDNWNSGHYVVAIGYDDKRFYFEDPSSVTRTYLSHKELSERWHDEDSGHKKYYNLGIVALGKIRHKIKLEHMD